MVRELRAGASYATYLTGASGPMYKLQNTNGTIRWYFFDGLGSVLGEVDPSGNVTTYAKYDVYGGVRSRTGTATSAHGYVGQIGHTSDAESGLIYMRARCMDPVTGRFVSEDPGRNGANWYLYGGNNVTNAVDVDGRVSRILCRIAADLLALLAVLGVGAWVAPIFRTILSWCGQVIMYVEEMLAANMEAPVGDPSSIGIWVRYNATVIGAARIGASILVGAILLWLVAVAATMEITDDAVASSNRSFFTDP